MEGRFLKGALVGGLVGAALVSNWDALVKKCPFLEDVKTRGLISEMSRRMERGETQTRPKTRLMARRHRVKKEG